MKKTLINKFILPAVLVGSLAVGSGCKTGAGYTMMQHPDPRVRGIGSMIYHEGAHEENMREAREGRDVYNNQKIPENVYIRDGVYNVAPGYQWVNPNDNTDLRVISEHIKIINEECEAAPGYQWVNPNDGADLRVRKIK